MAEGITRITVKGFKSIADECSLEIRPLTILAGANSSGKSSIMQPILMMKQTLEAPYDPGPLLIDGPNVRFTSAEQFLSKSDSEVMGKFSTGLEVESSNSIYPHETARNRSFDSYFYSYHWQDSDGSLRIRWDNSPHHKNLRTFPDHKHSPQLEESKEMSLEKALDEIRKFLHEQGVE